jgi:two-component system, chemotaxis family, response regulator Rcp1
VSDEGVRPHLLLVEDNPDDVELTRLALEEAGMRCDVEVVEDGADAIARMGAAKQPGGPPRPHLVLLDLNLPKVDGRDVLRMIKQDPDLALVPVLILTTSGDDHDIRFAYRNHANGFLVKPVDFDEFVQLLATMAAFWFGVVVLPPRTDPYDPYAG